MDDPLTGDVTHRLPTEDDEEQAQALHLADQYAVKPEIKWDGQPCSAKTVVFLIGQPASILIGTCIPTQAVGSVTVPELQPLRSPLEEEYGLAHPHTNTSTIHALCSSGGSSSDSGVLLVACPQALAAEQAAVWSSTVLGALQPQRLLVLSTIPASSYYGPGSPADEDLVFSLQTAAAEAAAAATAAAGKDASQLPPPLPVGTLLGGLPAALLSQAELEGKPAAAVVGVQMAQVPDARAVYSLYEAVGPCLTYLGESNSGMLGAAAGSGGGDLARQHLAALVAATDRIYRVSAGNSIFI